MKHKAARLLQKTYKALQMWYRCWLLFLLSSLQQYEFTSIAGNGWTNLSKKLAWRPKADAFVAGILYAVNVWYASIIHTRSESTRLFTVSVFYLSRVHVVGALSTQSSSVLGGHSSVVAFVVVAAAVAQQYIDALQLLLSSYWRILMPCCFRGNPYFLCHPHYRVTSSEKRLLVCSAYIYMIADWCYSGRDTPSLTTTCTLMRVALYLTRN